ncbi:hypothetical protein EDB85DRAFT_1346279 [Lactarius pseudohatsudake]|nr:hypothetical protein EDB85DRAFT_1346279 [Lactarius pseudohatsudake]
MRYVEKINGRGGSVSRKSGDDDDDDDDDEPLAKRRQSLHTVPAPTKKAPPVDWFEFFLNAGCDVDDCTRYVSPDQVVVPPPPTLHIRKLDQEVPGCSARTTNCGSDGSCSRTSTLLVCGLAKMKTERERQQTTHKIKAQVGMGRMARARIHHGPVDQDGASTQGQECAAGFHAGASAGRVVVGLL